MCKDDVGICSLGGRVDGDGCWLDGDGIGDGIEDGDAIGAGDGVGDDGEEGASANAIASISLLEK